MKSSKKQFRAIAFVLSVLFMFGATAQVVSAQDVTSDEVSAEAKPVPTLLRDKKEAAKDAMEARKAEMDEKKEEFQEKREENKADMEAKKEEFQEKREEQKARMDEDRKDRILKHVERIIERMTKAIDRLRTLAGKIDSRISKIEEERGVDMSTAKETIEAALGELDDAEANVNEMMTAAEEALEADTPKEAFEKVRDLFKNAKDDLHAAHKTLREAVQEAKTVISEAGGDNSGNDESSDDDSSSSDDSESSDDSNSSVVQELEGDVFTDTTLIKIEFTGGEKELFETSETERANIIAAIAASYDISEEDADAILILETENRESRDDDRVID